MKIVIVGGVAGGATAAARLRRLDENAQITVFDRTGYISYANCGLPYYIGGVIEDPSALTLQTPESFKRRFNVDMKVNCEVFSIDTEKKTVHVKNLSTSEEWDEPYDKLILSPGARPVVPDIPGTDLENVFTLRTVEDTFRIREHVKQNHPSSVLISGAGFIGLELAENLKEIGLDVTILQRSDQVMKPFDRDMASYIHACLKRAGIKLMFHDQLTALAKDDALIRASLKSGNDLSTDMVILATGVEPESELAKSAGLELGAKDSIVVDDHMRCGIEDIYAVGDAVMVKHFITGEDAVISLAGPANRQGRIAADNICGADNSYPGSQGTSIIKLFDMTVACTGINEKTAKSAGINYDKIYLSPANHAAYYPGGRPMTIKIIFEKNTYKLLGAQIVGYEGVDKRIDVLATAMYAQIPGDKLKELDLAYAPPYSSAKDPVNMAGFMIENIKTGKLKQFFFEDVEKLPRDGSVTLLDTRTVFEYSAGCADGFINIPVDELRDNLEKIEKGKPVYVMCQSGLRSYVACRILMQNGYDCYNFSGGYGFYKTVKDDIN